jgi:hypothetical protein
MIPSERYILPSSKRRTGTVSMMFLMNGLLLRTDRRFNAS